jgi:hypothetical protein
LREGRKMSREGSGPEELRWGCWEGRASSSRSQGDSEKEGHLQELHTHQKCFKRRESRERSDKTE